MNAIGSKECLKKPAKTLDEHWSDRRIFALIMVYATRLKAHRVAWSLGVKRRERPPDWSKYINQETVWKLFPRERVA